MQEKLKEWWHSYDNEPFDRAFVIFMVLLLTAGIIGYIIHGIPHGSPPCNPYIDC